MEINDLLLIYFQNAFVERKIISELSNLGSSFKSPLDSNHLCNTLFYFKGRLNFLRVPAH